MCRGSSFEASSVYLHFTADALLSEGVAPAVAKQDCELAVEEFSLQHTGAKIRKTLPSEVFVGRALIVGPLSVRTMCEKLGERKFSTD